RMRSGTRYGRGGDVVRDDRARVASPSGNDSWRSAPDTAVPLSAPAHTSPEATYGTPVPVPYGLGGFPASGSVISPYPGYPPMPPARPRPWWARRRVQRRLVPLLAVLLVGVILGDLVALTALTDEGTDPPRAAGQSGPPSRIDATPQGNISD